MGTELHLLALAVPEEQVMEIPEFKCTCKVKEPLTGSEKRIAEAMGVPVEWLHNFMDNWEDAYDVAYPM